MAYRLGAVVALVLVATLGCVDVPEGIRANFAAPAPQERSNFRQGQHGVARPAEDPAPAYADARDASAPENVGTTTTTSTTSPDGGAP